jgi:hypothetical protein
MGFVFAVGSRIRPSQVIYFTFPPVFALAGIQFAFVITLVFKINCSNRGHILIKYLLFEVCSREKTVKRDNTLKK